MPQFAEQLPMLRAKRLRMGRPPKPWEGAPIAQRTDEYRYIYLTHGKVALVDAADISVDGRTIYAAAIKYFGEFARLNFEAAR
jgi:hypothetical protein